MFSNDNAMKLEMDNRKTFRKFNQNVEMKQTTHK